MSYIIGRNHRECGIYVLKGHRIRKKLWLPIPKEGEKKKNKSLTVSKRSEFHKVLRFNPDFFYNYIKRPNDSGLF